MKRLLVPVLLLLLCCGGAAGQYAPGTGDTSREETLAEQKMTSLEKKLYLVATAHLDTQWRWTIRETISRHILATLEDNFELLEKYPDYVFSFEGAYHYMLMKEYYPDLYERLKTYVAADRWRVGGSWINAIDVNITSPESIIRNTLYGNGFYEQEFGKTSLDVYLPDCFGFSYALPTIAAHCGLIGFSTQKLTWGSAIGIPFNIGLWRGVDGSALISAVNPGAYVNRIKNDISADSAWVATVEAQGETSGLYVGYAYYGTGDTGGAPTEESVEWMSKSLNGAGPLTVIPAGSDQLMRDLTAGSTADLGSGLRSHLLARDDLSHLNKLPSHDGELVMTRHGVGCYTSQSAMKRWNRHNERLADAAERVSVIADWLGSAQYPGETLKEAWIRFLWHQFHDDLTGTSIPEAYSYSWNDELISLNQFSAVVGDGVGAVTRALDTDVTGIPVVVYNPLSIPREELIEAELSFPGGSPAAVRVYDAAGDEVPSQVDKRTRNKLNISFIAAAPSIGFAVYDVQPTNRNCRLRTGLTITETELENERYWVRIDTEGNIAAIRDKYEERDLLTAPIRLQMLADSPANWAAWEIDYDDIMATPGTTVGRDGAVTSRILASGPACVALEITREAMGSQFTQIIRLAAGGAADQIRVESDVLWRTPATLLKAAFPLNIINEKAVYDLGIGTIERGINHPELYEVSGQTWAAMTETDGSYGVAILNDCRYGWDRPSEKAIRLTLLHTPEVNSGWDWIKDEKSQDLGRHRFSYAVCGYPGDWRDGAVAWEAERLNQPMLAFQCEKHIGQLGNWFSLIDINAGEGMPTVAVKALKKAEASDEIIIRLQELAGDLVDGIRLEFPVPVTSAREVNGVESPVSNPQSWRSVDNRLEVSLDPYQPRAFAIRLAAPDMPLTPPLALPLALPYNIDGLSTDLDRGDGDFDGKGNSLSGDLLPRRLVRESIPFEFGPHTPGESNVLACEGQTLILPAGEFNRIYIIAAAVNGHRFASFAAGDKRHEFWVQDYDQPIGQWNNRLWNGERHDDPDDILPMYINSDRIAWVGNHRHNAMGENEPHHLTHLFRYRLDIPLDAQTLQLPADPSIRIMAITAANSENDVAVAVQPLTDNDSAAFARLHSRRNVFIDDIEVTMTTPIPGAEIRYTLDGTPPTASSSLYREPLLFTETTSVTARAIAAGMDDTYLSRALYSKVAPRQAALPGPPPAGLLCNYYEGEWSELPDFDSLTPKRSEIRTSVGIPSHVRKENYGLTYTGYVHIRKTGLYTFHLWSDDGSKLYVGGQLLIDHDGLHGNAEKTGDVALGEGLHPIYVEHFQAPGDAALELWLSGTDLEPAPIPEELLFTTDKPVPVEEESGLFDRLYFNY
jgi:alpha-mannosidase